MGISLPHFTLSDLFPHARKYKELQDAFGSEQLGYIEQPVSALDSLPNATFDGCSIITSFHHFDPPAAEKIIKNALTETKALLILEPFERSYKQLIFFIIGLPFLMLMPLLVSCATNLVKFRPIRAFLVAPIVTIALYFDGLVSIFRTYQVQEIIDFLPSGGNIKFQHGKLSPLFFIQANYFYIWRD